jgi:tripartite-type tricarboxylate transporter receptor subunit TctC
VDPASHIATIVAITVVCSGALAQSFPSRPIRLVVPYPPGGGTDIVARALAQKVGENIGYNVIVENRPGANGNIGMEAVARSAPDGYTLVYALFAQYAVNPHLYPKLPYDPLKDFAPVALIVRSPYILVAHPALPVKSLKELIALAGARRGQLAYASAGHGSGANLSGELLKIMAKVDLVHVPYKGAGPALVDLVAGQVPLSFATWSSAGPYAKAGRLHALAVTTAKRVSVLPDLPAISEMLPGYEMSVWYGIAAPAGTPRDIVARLNTEFVRALDAPDFRQRIAVDANEAIGGTPEQFGDYIKSELARWGRLVKEMGIRIE